MQPNQIKNKRILIAPLNWGYGHVARCIALIRELQANENEVLIAADRAQQKIFSCYFPNITMIDHMGYPFKFSKGGNFSLDLAKGYSKLRRRMEREKLETELLSKIYNIDITISDHRYGFKTRKSYSIFLTHQLNFPLRWYEKWVQRIHEKLMRKFDEVWVPDFENSELAGELSVNKANLNAEYIGPLSRFSVCKHAQKYKCEVTLIVSGEQVHASQFLDEQLSINQGEKINIILPASFKQGNTSSDFKIISSENWLLCDEIILNSKKIISRSGYSTLMDLYFLKTPFSITPTPGQREQEYLFAYWSAKINAGVE